MLAPTGLINSLLRAVGLDGLARNWLADPHLVKPVLVCVIAWASAGTGVVIFSAALSALDPSLLEAADVEGASGRAAAALRGAARGAAGGRPVHRADGADGLRRACSAGSTC